MSEDNKPINKSADRQEMEHYYRMVDAILGGVKTMRDSNLYLPQHPDESDPRYQHRKKNSKLTNVFRDITENLAQRPFSNEVRLTDESTSQLINFSENVDGRGTSLHSFAGEVMFAGINYSIDWILVDYSSQTPENATRAMERQMGIRPFWCRYPAPNVLAAYTAMINGEEQFVHVRLLEHHTKRVGFQEQTTRRVRVFNREETSPGIWSNPTWELWEEKEQNRASKTEDWERISGPTPMTIDEIPLVPFLTGRRIGSSFKTHPPMRDAADLQIELYQQESDLKHIRALTAFPILAGNGVNPPIGDNGEPEPVGIAPHAVLYAPPDPNGGSGRWEFIEPSAESLKFLSGEVKETIQQLRELGRQPLTAQSGNLTVVTTAFAAEKGNSAIQAWALNLRFSLEKCLQLTAKWLKIDIGNTAVVMDLDFDLGFGDDDSYEHVLKLRENGEISRDTALEEAKRRSILSSDFDADEDAEKLLEDTESDDEEDDDIDDDDASPPSGEDSVEGSQGEAGE